MEARHQGFRPGAVQARELRWLQQATSDLCTERDLPDDFYFIDSGGRWCGYDAVGPWTMVANTEGKIPDWFTPIASAAAYRSWPRSRLSPNLM